MLSSKPDETPEEVREFIRFFNSQKFFEAHEVLETLWKKEKQKGLHSDPKLQNLYQGLIQISAALVHVQKKNPEGANWLFHSASGYLQNIPLNPLSIDVAALIQNTSLCLQHQKSFPQID